MGRQVGGGGRYAHCASAGLFSEMTTKLSVSFFLSAEKRMLSIFQKQKQNELLHIGVLLGAFPVGGDDCNV